MITIFASWLIADFLTGLFHWWQDCYLEVDSKYKFAVALAIDNELHHTQPAAMTKLSEWENMRNSAEIGWPVAWIFYMVGFPTIVWLPFFFGSFGNLVHRYAHLPPGKIPKPIAALQKVGLFVSPAHHGAHHFGPNGVIAKKDAFEKFCPMTNYVNPVLDFFRFFQKLELLLSLFGIERRK